MCLDNWSWRWCRVWVIWHLLVTINTSMLQTLCVLKRECCLSKLLAIAASAQWITSEWLSLEESVEGHWVQIPCSSRATCIQLSRTISRYTQNTCKERSSAKSPGSHWSLNLTVSDGLHPHRPTAPPHPTIYSCGWQVKKPAPF